MSMSSSSRAPRFPAVPKGERVGAYERYEEAQHAVDLLVRSDFPVSGVSIVGSELRSVERVTGRMNAGRAALGGLVSGLMLGAFVGLLVLLMTPNAGIGTLGAVVLVAIGFGVIWSLVTYLVNPAKKEFTSAMQVVASHFEIIVAPEHAARARQVLGTGPALHAPSPFQPAAVPGSGAPAKGEAPTTPEGVAQAPAPAPAPATPPRTYGEAQDALRREQQARNPAGGSPTSAPTRDDRDPVQGS